MKKQITLVIMALIISCSAEAQFIKKLEKALQKANSALNSVSGQTGSNPGSNKTGYITYQEEPSFVNSWGAMEFIKAVGNSENGAIQVIIRIKTKSGKHYSVKADKVYGPNGEKLVENKNWTRGEWTLKDAANGIYVSPVWVVPTTYKSLSHICVVTYLQDIWADIHNIPIEWQKPASGGTSLPAISQKSFGSVRIGMRLQNVPKTMRGVYTRVQESGYGCDGTQYECYDGDDNVLTVADSDGDNIVDEMTVFKQGVKIEGTPIYIGMPLNSLRAVKGIRRLNKGSDYYKYGNYEIYLSENNTAYMVVIR